MLKKGFHFLIVEDDLETAKLYGLMLKKAGHEVTICEPNEDKLKKIIKLEPDCVISDIIMPDLDGIDLLRQVRETKNIKQPKYIMITGKIYDFDYRRAMEQGADGYLNKPIDSESFIDEIMEIVNDRMLVTFWGIRGTLPVSGKDTIRYGGDTNCVSLNIGKKCFFVFDAGTGFRILSNRLMSSNQPINAQIFITHIHYDHVNGIPFFVPFYTRGNKFDIFGPSYAGMDIQKLIAGLMDNYYFPVTMREFVANLSFKSLKEETLMIHDVQIDTLLLNHPGQCLGYRVKYKDKIFCYITDNELYHEDSPFYSQFDVERLVNFILNANVLVIDTTYSDEEYSRKINWGHSCVSVVMRVANQAKVDRVCLYHHDPGQTDEDIDTKLKDAQLVLQSLNSKTTCIAPAEGDEIII